VRLTVALGVLIELFDFGGAFQRHPGSVPPSAAASSSTSVQEGTFRPVGD
jgi:hypothetical protein